VFHPKGGSASDDNSNSKNPSLLSNIEPADYTDSREWENLPCSRICSGEPESFAATPWIAEVFEARGVISGYKQH
jgi:hypothetical protein